VETNDNDICILGGEVEEDQPFRSVLKRKPWEPLSSNGSDTEMAIDQPSSVESEPLTLKSKSPALVRTTNAGVRQMKWLSLMI
jgi:hypothetical protein